MSALDQIRTTLRDLATRRGPVTVGGLPHNFLELYGAEMVEVTAFEPDPKTYRNEYYYNASQNQLYRRIVIERRTDGIVIAKWFPTGC